MIYTNTQIFIFRLWSSLFFHFFMKLKLFPLIYNYFKYPNYIRTKIQEIDIPKCSFNEILKYDVIERKIEYKTQSEKIIISHSGNEYIYNKDLFKKEFVDPEISFYINRFAWIFIALSKNDSNFKIQSCYSAILDWIHIDEIEVKKKLYDSYSISERLTNWIIFFIQNKQYIIFNKEDIDKIELSLFNQINYLINNLEYWGPYTNNHIFNNGRALYILGRVLNIPKVANLGKEIIYNYSSLLMANGFIQEDSSHYQLIVSRWLFDIYFIANFTRDLEWLNFIKPLLTSAISACNILFSNYSNQLPLYGDISPDLAPKSFYGYPYNIQSRQFAPIYYYPEKYINLKYNKNTIHKSKNYNSWEKFSFEKIELWLMKKNIGILSHGHNDNGALSIYYSGLPIVVDPGCLNYLKNNPIAKSQVQYNNHFSAFLLKKTFDVKIPIRFHKNNILSSKLILYNSKKSFVYRLFSYDRSVNIKRRVIFEQNDLIITDIYDSSICKYNYSTSLCIIKKIDQVCLNDKVITFSIEGVKIRLEIINAEKINIQAFEVTQEYGLSIIGTIINVIGKKEELDSIKFCFSFGKNL